MFDDKIVLIEELEDEETIDITVDGDHFFFCNNILTKNSIGMAFTADLAILLYTNPDLLKSGQMMVKQEKNRYKNLNYKRRFVIGVDYEKMRWYDVEESAQPPLSIDDDPNQTVPKPKKRISGVH
jgi:hypothetical protein